MTSKLCLVLVEISNPPNPLWLTTLAACHGGLSALHSPELDVNSWIMSQKGREGEDRKWYQEDVSGGRNASLPAQWDTLPKPRFWKGKGISGTSPPPASRYKTDLPLGGSGHSRGHVADHGVVHISQGARRAERKRDLHHVSNYQGWRKQKRRVGKGPATTVPDTCRARWLRAQK